MNKIDFEVIVSNNFFADEHSITIGFLETMEWFRYCASVVIMSMEVQCNYGGSSIGIIRIIGT